MRSRVDIYPVRILRGEEELSDTEWEYFSRINWLVHTVMVFVMVLLAIGIYKTLVSANQYFADTEGPARFQLLPTQAIWWFLPGFAAICLSWQITLFLWSLFVGHNKVNRFAKWTHTRAGFNSTKILRWMGLLIVLPIAIATSLAVPEHSTLHEWGIAERSYASLSSKHLNYADARRLMTIAGFLNRDGKFTGRAEILIDFSNGYRWHSENERDFRANFEPGLLEFLQKKTGLPVQYAQVQSDLPPAGQNIP